MTPQTHDQRAASAARPRRGVAIAIAIAIAALAGGACGDDKSKAAVDLANLGRYCELASSLDASLGAELGSTAAPAEGLKAEAASAAVAALGPTFDLLPQLAPKEIRADVKTVVGAIRAAADGDVAPAKAPAFQEARKRLSEFSAGKCPGGSASGDL